MTNRKELLREFLLMNLGTLLVSVGVYFFKFPNHFSMGGVSGLAVLLGKLRAPALPLYLQHHHQCALFGAGLCNAQQGLRRPDGLLFHSLRRAHSAL